MDFEPMCPGFESRESHDFFFVVVFYVFFVIIITVQICKFNITTGWERTGQMLCIVDTSLSVLMTLRMCLRELCCLFTVWI